MKSIHIYENGPVVTAILKDGKQTVSAGVAKCSPEDTFDFETGAKLAMERALHPIPQGLKWMAEHLEEIHRNPLFDKPRIVKQDRYEVGDTVVFCCGGEDTIAQIECWPSKRYFFLDDNGELNKSCSDGAIKGKVKKDKPVQPVREVKRPAKVGEWVRIVRDNGWLCHGKKVGDVVYIDGEYERPSEGGSSQFIWGTGLHPQDYVVLENYDPEVHGK